MQTGRVFFAALLAFAAFPSLGFAHGDLHEQIATSPRKEAWLELRGDILSAADRPEDARQAYRADGEAILALPANRRVTKATAELEERLKQKAAR